jgi:hypothetical protein
MRSLFLSLVLSLLIVPPAAAQQCNLQMNVVCEPGSGGGPSRCIATTRNAGTTSCSGEGFAGFFSEIPHTQARFTNLRTSLGFEECLDSAEFGELIPQAFAFCTGGISLAAGASFTATTDITRSAGAPSQFSIIGFTVIFDEATGDTAGEAFALAEVKTPTCTPSITVPPLVQSDVDYTITWSEVSDLSATWILEEATNADFTANLRTQTSTARSATFRHTATEPTAYYYRVRAANCAGTQAPPFSQTASVVVQGTPAPATRSGEAVAPFGSTTPVSIPIFVPPANGKDGVPTPFTAKSDKPYITVTPASGTITATGITITATVNPTGLPPGGNTGTVTVSTPANPNHANTVVSVSLVTPVTPGGKTLPAPNTLLIPVVTHVNSFNGPFLSDVRLTNADSIATKYQITMTPTQTDGTQSGRSTQLTVDAGQTIALNDIVKNFFGLGATSNASDVGFGSLEIRPLETSSLLTYASSRTYASTPDGTFGQYVSAVRVSELATNALSGGPIIPGLPSDGPPPILSLQQVAQSAKFRTNLGIVEGSGTPASGRIRIVDDNGAVLADVPYSLLPGEHQQINSFMQRNGVTNLEDGRIEITIDSEEGAVTAYASVLDNITTDPLAVMPVDITRISSSRYILPGMADLNNGAANFHSDIRIFNAGASAVTVTPTFYPQGNQPAKAAAPITLRPREVRAIDNVLPTLFQSSGTGGSIVLTTPDASSLVATGRTYSIAANNGTFGQFIPGVSPGDGIGAGEPAMQILQLEHSPNFRTNVGLVELTGNKVRVKLTLTLPDSRVSPVTELDLEPNEFRQLNGVIASLNPGNTYNARIAVEVVSGSGRITSYASVIDNATQDPTYVPAQ